MDILDRVPCSGDYEALSANQQIILHQRLLQFHAANGKRGSDQVADVGVIDIGRSPEKAGFDAIAIDCVHTLRTNCR
eukprot:383443-Lingulodinium_polyedra.AAC.2